MVLLQLGDGCIRSECLAVLGRNSCICRVEVMVSVSTAVGGQVSVVGRGNLPARLQLEDSCSALLICGFGEVK
jgi:hypothetical protein